ncbi:hypothetical protein G6L37_03690 [Agrobacterium rubi]|nr:hypothetical protein [Agrobacterium rubi]NTF24454.1 hypothetical protein [Agrobacterium rubi]
MQAKTKGIGFALAICTSLFSHQAYAQEPLTTPQDETCLEMAQIPIGSVTDKLRLFAGDVLGKNAELWQERDFQALLANARVCDGRPVGIEPKVTFQSWMNALHGIYPIVRKVTDISVPISERYKGVFPVPGGLMLCTRLFDFRKDPIWLTSNSGEIFGKPFEAMEPEMLSAARKFVNECEPVLLEVLKARRKNENDAARLVRSINISIDRDQKIPEVHIENLDEQLIPKRDGKVIPLAYVSPNTVSVVRRVNTSLLRKARLQTDDLILISKWADNVFDLVPEGPDRAYAERIKSVITTSMFPD